MGAEGIHWRQETLRFERRVGELVMETETETAVLGDRTGEDRGVTLSSLDALVLEQALRERSGGTMVAPLRDVVQLAVERWGFPGSVGAAEAVLLNSGRYVVEPDPTAPDEMIRPRHPALVTD